MTAQLPPQMVFQPLKLNASGVMVPIPGGKLYTYQQGTLVPQAVYTDATLTTPCTNPLVLDANGISVFWMAPGGYQFWLKDSSDVTIYPYPIDRVTNTIDGIQGVQGLQGTPGSVWRDGSGTPSSLMGIDGDYYLDNVSGDVWCRVTGVYALRGNIKGPPAATVNAIENSSFYGGAAPWSLFAALSNGITPVLLGGRFPNSKAPSVFAQSLTTNVLAIGEVTQGFAICNPMGTMLITFYMTAWRETATPPNTAYSAQVKAYIHNAQNDTETLVGTFPILQGAINTTYATATWNQQSIDITAYLPSIGTYGVRFEVQSTCDNTGGVAGGKGIYCAIDDVVLNVTGTGVAGPTGPAGPQGPVGPAGSGYQQKVIFISNGSWTPPANVNFADVLCVGGGGGGGGGAQAANSAGGGGGGAAATILRRVPVTPGTPITIVIGTAGSGGATNVAGTAGTATTFGALITANGGGSGGAGALSVPGLAGSAAFASVTGVTPGGRAYTYSNSTGTGSAVNMMFGNAVLMGGSNGGVGGTGSSSSPTAGGNGYPSETANGGTGGSAGSVYGGGGGGGACPYGNGGQGQNGGSGGGGQTPSAGNYGSAGGGGGGVSAGGSAGGGGAPGYAVVWYQG